MLCDSHDHTNSSIPCRGKHAVHTWSALGKLFDEVASGFGELGVAENVGVAVGISSIPRPVSEMQSISSLVSAMLI